MSKLCKGVVLVHELRERRGAEELADRRRNRTCIDKSLGTKVVVILESHSLLDVLVHPGHTDSHLVLKKLAYATKSSVTEVVDIVGRTNAVG